MYLRYFGTLFCMLLIISCGNDDVIESSEPSIDILNEQLNPLQANPLLWEDSELQWLDRFGDKQMVGLGEATHGTSEFFTAKHRIFRYLVEHHDFKVFAFEADFGESLFLNEVIQNGDCDQIKSLMLSKMHFWTWRTTEVQELLEWMCNYNTSREDSEKLQYYGVDCAFNTYHPDMVLDYLEDTEAPFLEEARPLLNEAKSASENSFQRYTESSFDEYLQQLTSLQDSIDAYRDYFVDKTSLKEYELQRRLVRVIFQVSEVRRTIGLANFESDPRDPRMAENALWVSDFLEGEKVAVWAHNGHIDKNEENLTMGHHLSQELSTDYAAVGFAFSKGSFRAVGQGGLRIHSIEVEPNLNSLNSYLTQAETPQYSINVTELFANSEWRDKSAIGLEYLFIGSLFNRPPETFYNEFQPDFFDELIYLDRTNTAEAL